MKKIYLIIISIITIFSFYSSQPLVSISLYAMKKDKTIIMNEELYSIIISTGKIFYLIGKFINSYLSIYITIKLKFLINQILTIFSLIGTSKK
jgi:hypothetical protein